jgi:hypothetical protein
MALSALRHWHHEDVEMARGRELDGRKPYYETCIIVLMEKCKKKVFSHISHGIDE